MRVCLYKRCVYRSGGDLQDQNAHRWGITDQWSFLLSLRLCQGYRRGIKKCYCYSNSLHCAALRARAESKGKQVKEGKGTQKEKGLCKTGVDGTWSCFAKEVLPIKGSWTLSHFLCWPGARAQRCKCEFKALCTREQIHKWINAHMQLCLTRQIKAGLKTIALIKNGSNDYVQCKNSTERMRVQHHMENYVSDSIPWNMHINSVKPTAFAKRNTTCILYRVSRGRWKKRHQSTATCHKSRCQRCKLYDKMSFLSKARNTIATSMPLTVSVEMSCFWYSLCKYCIHST